MFSYFKKVDNGRMKNVLVTGATGFIGQRLVKALELKVGKPRVLSRVAHANCDTVICDLRTDRIPKAAIANIDTVFHLAGISHDTRAGDKDSDLYYKVNVDATTQLVELAHDSQVKRFVFVSSVKAGGLGITGQCLTETDQGEPDGVYGKTKREAELKLLAVGRNSPMKVSVIRPSLVYGPMVKGNLKVMSSAIRKGWFPPLPETGNRRSLIHVDDVVSALLMVAVDNRANGEIFIATDGDHYSARDIYKAMCKSHGKELPSFTTPLFLFDAIASINPSYRDKIDKILGDACYSSEKLQRLGFEAKLKLKDMNETFF